MEKTLRELVPGALEFGLFSINFFAFWFVPKDVMCMHELFHLTVETMYKMVAIQIPAPIVLKLDVR